MTPRIPWSAAAVTGAAAVTLVILVGGPLALHAATAPSGTGSGGCYTRPDPQVKPLSGDHLPPGPAPTDIAAAEEWVRAHAAWAAGVEALQPNDIVIGVTKDACKARTALRTRLPNAHVVIVPAYHSLDGLAPLSHAMLTDTRHDPSVAALGIHDVIITYNGQLLVSLGARHPTVDEIRRTLAKRYTRGDTSWFFVGEVGPWPTAGS
jgi:hypothetical protein